MQVKRFLAADMRRALELVRQELGPDAIILSSGRTPEGVELLTTMGTDNELMQLQQQPLGRMAFASASPMISDGAWSETALVNRAATQSSQPFADNKAFIGSNNKGKTGKQLVDEIEQARLRMIASRKAEASAQEFLVSKNTGSLRQSAGAPPAINPAARQTQQPVQKSKATMSAAERYPLIDPTPAVKATDAVRAPVAVKAPVAVRPPVAEKSAGIAKAPVAQVPPVKTTHAVKTTQVVEASGAAKAISPLKASSPVKAPAPAKAANPVNAPVRATATDAVAVKPLLAKASTTVNSAALSKPNPINNRQLQELQAEIADMRFLLEKQLDRLGAGAKPLPGSAVLGSVSRRLERLGLPAEFVGKILKGCKTSRSLSDAWPDALANLAHQLPVNNRDIIDQGGTFAFVGPTGVGKTTTIGKLAARYVLKYGPEHVALITTDTYRIAAHDQLRSIARILRVPVRVVDESNTLESLLHSLRYCSLVLIDTAGFRHGDPHLKAQLAVLAKQPKVKSYLVLSCNSQEQMLKASIHAYGPARLQGCILTKLDETTSLGEALGVVTQSKLAIAYTTDGQDIPKNIEVARAHQLVAKAVGLLKKNPASAVS